MRLDPGALVRLTRPVNCAISLVSVLVGAGMGGDIPSLVGALTAGVSASLIAGGGNALNDACDEVADRLNRPDRPIPSGRVSGRASRWFAVTMFATGSGLGFWLGMGTGSLALVATGGLVAYDFFLKKVAFVGNLAIACISALALVYGGVVAGTPGASLVPAAFAFLMHLGREVLKDIGDMEGDRAASSSSVAVHWGPHAARLVVTGVLILLAVLIPIPYVLGLYNQAYLLLALFPVNLILLYVVSSLWRDGSRRNLLRLDSLLKADMVFGLLALWTGRPILSQQPNSFLL